MRGLTLFLNNQDTEAEQDEQVDTNSLQETEPPPPILWPRVPRSHSWEFPKERLQIRDVFGQGAFGQVAKGLALQISGKAGWSFVAIKMLKGLQVQKHF